MSNTDTAKSAEMTYKQFLALSLYLKKFDHLNEIKQVRYFQNTSACKNPDFEKAKNLIFNGWNTERILRKTSEILSNDENYFALQWSFPQAYYSVYCLTLAFLRLNGQTVSAKHAKVASKFGEFIESGKYPKYISFHQKGTMSNPQYFNITRYPSKNPLFLDHKSIESCQTQICQFLNATRNKLLTEKRTEMKSSFKTKKGLIKKSLHENDWEQISKTTGNTNILHLLYRKRIKSNYEDIDTFNNEEINAKHIHDCLISITEQLNLLHECYIYKMIGSDKYIDLYFKYKKGKNIIFLDKRIELITNNI